MRPITNLDAQSTDGDWQEEAGGNDRRRNAHAHQQETGANESLFERAIRREGLCKRCGCRVRLGPEEVVCASCVRPAPRVSNTCAPRAMRVPRATLGDGRIVFAPSNASSIFVFDPERGTIDGGWWVVGAGRWEVVDRWWGVRVHTFQKLE